MSSSPSAPQARFDALYITASEIGRELEVSRASVHYARQRGVLPDPISVGSDLVYVWDRAAVRPFIDAWKVRLEVKKGVPA